MKVICNFCFSLVKISKGYFPKLIKRDLLPSIFVKRDLKVSCQYFSKTNTSWGKNKSHRNIKISKIQLKDTADPKMEVILAPLRRSVKEQVSLFK